MIAPAATFFASSPVVVERTRSMFGCSASTPLTGKLRPSTRTERTAKARRIGSLAFSERFTSVTSSTTVAPAGIRAPFAPVTVSLSVAVKRSPGRLVLVQTRCEERMLSVVPAAIVPSDSPPPVPVVAVLPPAVRVGSDGAGVVGDFGAGEDGRGALGRGAGVVRGGVAGVLTAG